MTRRRVGTVLFLGLAGALGYLIWLQTSVRMGGTPAALHGSARTEEEWIVKSIVSDLSQMALAASGAKGADLGGVQVEAEPDGDAQAGRWQLAIRLPGREQPVERAHSLLPHPWTPEAYVNLVRDLLPRPPAPLELPDREMAARLLVEETTASSTKTFG